MPCDDCHYADWKKTKSGRLHPDKTGHCTFVWLPPPLPKAFYFVNDAKPFGGFIERGDHKTDGCDYFCSRRQSVSANGTAGEGI